MKHSELDKKIKVHMEKYKKDILGITERGTWRNSPYDHILPKLESNLLPMAKWPEIFKAPTSATSKILFPEKREVKTEYVKPHVYANHLNSSQVMCINFFSPLCHDEKGKEILLKLICQATGFSFSADSKIRRCEFELSPNKEEKTSVDFYIKFTTGEEIFFEIKYIESEFGSANSKTTDYGKQWTNIYRDMCENSLLLQDLDEVSFYNHYQIFRNIVLVQDEKRFVCFVYPFVSDLLRREMEDAQKLVKQTNPRQVAEVDWVELCKTAKELTKGTEFYFHFYLFEQKYIIPLI